MHQFHPTYQITMTKHVGPTAGVSNANNPPPPGFQKVWARYRASERAAPVLFRAQHVTESWVKVRMVP